MLINLSDVLSEHHKTIDKTTSVEMTEFHSELGRFPVLEKEDVHIVVKHVKNRELMITGEGRLVLEIPCDRCLEAVPPSLPGCFPCCCARRHQTYTRHPVPA